MAADIKEVIRGEDVTSQVNEYFKDLAGNIAKNPELKLEEDVRWQKVSNEINGIIWTKQETASGVTGVSEDGSKWVGDLEIVEENGVSIYKAKFRKSGIMGNSVDTFMSVKDGVCLQASLTSNVTQDGDDLGFREWTYVNEDVVKPMSEKKKVTVQDLDSSKL